MRLVYGLGRSGLGVLRFLRKRGFPPASTTTAPGKRR